MAALDGAVSVFDTHCEGAGLSPDTKPWSTLVKRFWQFERFGLLMPYSMSLPRALPPRVDLKGKYVVVSGANSGIGLEASYTFALWGAHVIMACRANCPPHETSPSEARKQIIERGAGNVDEDQLEVWDLDLSSFQSARSFAKKYVDSGRPLDILCNNAGLASPKYIKTEDGVELTRSVNYLGHCLLTLALLPALKKAKAPRVVNTCSCFHFQGTLDFANMDYEKSNGEVRGPGGVQAYCDTKLYFTMWTKELQDRLSESDEYRHIIVNGVHPGFIGSNIWNAPGIKDLMWPQPQLLNFLISSLAVSTEQGSLCILHGALHPAFGIRPSELKDLGGDSPGTQLPKGFSAQRGGHYIQRERAETPRPECFDRLARGRLWNRTLQDINAQQHGYGQDLPQNPFGLM